MVLPTRKTRVALVAQQRRGRHLVFEIDMRAAAAVTPSMQYYLMYAALCLVSHMALSVSSESSDAAHVLH